MAAAGAGGRVAVWAARLLAVLACVLAAVAVALPLLGGYGYLPDLMGTPEVVVAVTFSATGALLVGSEQARRIGWLLLGIGGSAGLYTAAVSYTAFSLHGVADATLPPGSRLAWVTAWIATWAWFPAWLLVSTVLPQVVPYGRPLSARWRLPLVVAGLVLAVGVVEFALSPGELGIFTGLDNPLGVWALEAPLATVGRVLDVLVPLLTAVGLVSVVVRFARADGTERRQVGWFGYAVTMTVLIILVVPSIWINAVVLLIPAGLAVAALRYRLYDLDLLVNRTVVIGLLLGGAALTYAALVGWVGSLFGRSNGVIPFVAAFAVALVFHPARVRVQRAVDRLFFGRRGDPYGLLRALDRSLREAEDPRSALAAGARLVRSGLRLPGAALVVPLPGGGEVRQEAGSVGDAAESVPLVLHGERVGSLLAAPRPARKGMARLAEADLRALATLAGPLASAAYALRLSARLEESHRRLLGAREEERRRLRRDLHDGLGPQLAGVVMGLEVVRSAVSRGDRARAEELAGAVTGQARTAVEDVRRLVAGLRPPVLDDLGLLAALQATGPAAAPGGPTVSVRARGDLDRLPALVEVAAFRIAQEAMTNALRHGDAHRIDVLLDRTARALTVQIRDDGRGVADGSQPGVGLASMQERAGELGGWCTVLPGRPGTVVTAHLPLVGAVEPQQAPAVEAPA